jgi:hypothetical protein
MRAKAIALFIGAMTLAACNDGDLTNVVIAGVDGTFILQSANGMSLPALLVDSVSPPLRIDVLSGSITLRPDGTFQDVTDFRRTVGTIVTNVHVICPGTYLVSGASIAFAETGAEGCRDQFVGTLSGGNTLTASIRGVRLVYVR